jgi:hypothetical protein
LKIYRSCLLAVLFQFCESNIMLAEKSLGLF